MGMGGRDGIDWLECVQTQLYGQVCGFGGEEYQAQCCSSYRQRFLGSLLCRSENERNSGFCSVDFDVFLPLWFKYEIFQCFCDQTTT